MHCAAASTRVECSGGTSPPAHTAAAATSSGPPHEGPGAGFSSRVLLGERPGTAVLVELDEQRQQPVDGNPTRSPPRAHAHAPSLPSHTPGADTVTKSPQGEAGGCIKRVSIQLSYDALDGRARFAQQRLARWGVVRPWLFHLFAVVTNGLLQRPR